MKKKLLSLLGLATVTASLTSAMVLAVNPVQGFCNTPGAGGTLVCQETAQDSQGQITGGNGLVVDVAQTLVYVAGIISVILLIMQGIKFATSQGDSGKIQSAKNGITYALVGLVIAIFAQAIVTFFLTRIF